MPLAPSVLLVDDDESVLSCLDFAFRVEGFKTLLVDCVRCALETAKSEIPDGIVMDYSLPDMTGRDALILLKGDPTTQAIPVVMHTGTLDPHQERESLKDGAKNYLVKGSNSIEALPLHMLNILNRARNISSGPLQVGLLSLDVRLREVRESGRILGLKKMEYALLSLLMMRSPELVSWEEIQRDCWHRPIKDLCTKSTGAISVALSHLRGKLSQETNMNIQTVRGRGLVLVAGV